jgi:uncharacterized membrane protein
MNIHPILVHFPIGLLTIYALLEFLRFKALLQKVYWFYLKAGLVLIGCASSIVTFLSGDAIEGMFRGFPDQMHLVSVHSNFALASCLLFGAIAFAYLVQWLAKENISFNVSAWKYLVRLTHQFLQGPAVVLLALAGLFCVTVTGALGGALVYGSDIDPVVSFIYKLFIK